MESSCSSCNYNYGEYLIDMETYLEATLEFKNEQQEQYCETCNQCVEWAAEEAENDDQNGDQEENDEAWKCQNINTNSCYEECQNIENTGRERRPEWGPGGERRGLEVP